MLIPASCPDYEKRKKTAFENKTSKTAENIVTFVRTKLVSCFRGLCLYNNTFILTDPVKLQEVFVNF